MYDRNRKHGRKAMRTIFGSFALFLLLVSTSSAFDSSPTGAEAIRELLTRVKEWTVLRELTPASTPTDGAGVEGFEFFLRGGELVGRTTHMADGYNCEFVVIVRDNGFDFSRCGGYSIAELRSVDYDAGDTKYPFKRLDAPVKVWLTPKP